MLDDVKDFVKSFTDRFSSPLFGSFVISWLIINYEIPITLFFYKQNELMLDGYPSYLHVIWQQSSLWKFGILPIALALAYVIGYPFIKNGISILHAKADAWGGNWVIKATKGQKIDISKFLTLREELRSARLRVDELYEQDSGNILEISSLRERSKELEGIIEIKDQEVSSLKEPTDPKFLYGLWDFKLNTVTSEKVFL